VVCIATDTAGGMILKTTKIAKMIKQKNTTMVDAVTIRIGMEAALVRGGEGMILMMI